ncbi:MAG: hypothetical protein LBV67_07590 [Streptococcaceae bacterium]|jgi:hypothetical protein|nr:hypothetical protein [Streptococcaceae bacterium]
MKKLYQSRKRLIIGGVIGLVTLGLLVVTIHQKNVQAKTEQVRADLVVQHESSKKVLKQVEKLFDEKQEFLAKNVTKEHVMKIWKNSGDRIDLDSSLRKSLSNEFKTYQEENEKIDILLKKALQMSEIQTKVNSIFTEPVLNGSALKENPVIRKDLFLAVIDEVATMPNEKAFNGKIQLLKKIAKTQLEDIESAKKAVDSSEKDKGNRELNEKAIEAANKIKNPDVKKSYMEKLNPIKAELDKKDEESKQAETQNIQEQANASGQPVYDSNTGQYVQPSIPNNNGSNSNYNPGASNSTSPPSTGGGSGNSGNNNSGGSGGGTVTPPPPPPVQTRYTAWAYKDGQKIILGTFNTWQEADTVGFEWCLANDGDSWGCDTF